MPPALAKAAQLTDAQVEATREYALLTQLSTIGGITVSAGKALWPGIADVPDTVFGVIDQWVNKRSMTVRITWTEADGEKRYDVEDLHILLLPQCEFKLLKGSQGEALLLRGAARATYAAQQPKRKVSIKYTEGALEKEQVWEVEDDPEAITSDARTEDRYPPRLARRSDQITTPFDAWYNAAVPHAMLVKMEKFFNQRLDGQKHENRKTTLGELVRFMSYMGALSLQPGTPLREMWKQVPSPKDIFPPPAMGKYGLSKNRFLLLAKLAGEAYPLNETGMDATDPWRFSRMPVDMYNEHMAEVFSAGWNFGPDESMSAFTGEAAAPHPAPIKPHQIPHAMFVPRKPEPLGCELEDAADAQCGAIFFLEINEGAVRMASKEYVSEYGATTACSLRLAEGYHNTKRAWGGDSWFIGVREVETLLAHGLYAYGDVKTHTARYPTEEIMAFVGPNSGDWAVMTTKVAGDHKIYAIAHRRGGAVHTYLSSHGQSISGKPQAHKDDVDALGVRARPRPCPKVLNDWTAQQPQIDKRNRERQDQLAMEKRFVTHSFPFRLFTTVLGITFTTAKCFYDYFNKPYDGSFLDFMQELCYDGMTNTIDMGGLPATPSAPRPAFTPGAPSPFASPTRAAATHTLQRLVDIRGYEGSPQMKCSVCKKNATRCCQQCSRTPGTAMPYLEPFTLWGELMLALTGRHGLRCLRPLEAQLLGAARGGPEERALEVPPRLRPAPEEGEEACTCQHPEAAAAADTAAGSNRRPSERGAAAEVAGCSLRLIRQEDPLPCQWV